jgi:hypothetical protein
MPGSSYASLKHAGQAVGLLLLAQSAAAPVVNFRLTRPVVRSPELLANVAAGASQVRGAALLLFAMGALAVGIAVTASSALRRHGERLALWLLALGTIECVVHVIEGMVLLALVSLGQEAAGAAGDAAAFRAAGVALRAGCVWGHYVGMLVGGGTALMLYALLYRSAVVPRALAALGVGAAALAMAAVAMPMLGYSMALPLLAPLGLCHVLLVLWLLACGFQERRASPHDGARKVRLAGA